MLQLSGQSQLAQFRALLPSTDLYNVFGPPPNTSNWGASGYPLSVSTTYSLEVANRLLNLCQGWSGARTDLGYVYTNDGKGFAEFARDYATAAAEALTLAGHGANAFPLDEQRAITTMVSHRCAKTGYLASLDLGGGASTALLSQIGVLSPGATVAITDQSGVVTDVPLGTNLRVGEVVDLVGLSTSPGGGSAGQATCGYDVACGSDLGTPGMVVQTPSVSETPASAEPAPTVVARKTFAEMLKEIPWWIWLLVALVVFQYMEKRR